MSPLRCNTVKDALWERAASAGPAALSPALAEHLEACTACRAENAAVRDLLAVARELPDPVPPAGLWDGFEEALARGLAASRRSAAAGRIRRTLDGMSWRAVGLAALLAGAFAMGILSDRALEPERPVAEEARREALLADLEAELQNDARLESYVDEIEDLVVAYQATERGEALATFHRSLPTTMVAGSGVPSDMERERLEQQRATREQIRSLVIGMLASEIETESHGFAYLDRRIASIAGQQLLYFIR